jgi:nucleoside phosphorylase
VAVITGWSNAPAWAEDSPSDEKTSAAQDSTAVSTPAAAADASAQPAASTVTPRYRSLFDAVRRVGRDDDSSSPASAIRKLSQRQSKDVNIRISRSEPADASAVATPPPRKPVDSPAVWAMHAFARREFDPAVRAPAAVATTRPATPRTISETKVADTAVEPEKRTLVLTAFPAEADAILARTTLDENPVVVVDGRHYYLGTLGGKKVIVAMTGIGTENATNTTETALTHFTAESGTSVNAVVFAGVAGGSGRSQIGDVAVPARWTADDGATWRAVDADMLAAASAVTVDLESTDTVADPSCRICGPLARLRLVDLGREPQVHVGGDGSSDDNNNGAPFPAIPLGGAVFGPQPLSAPDFSPLFTGNFLQAIGPFLARGVIGNVIGFLTATSPPVDAVDQETAAAQQVADAHGVPFLGIRGMSDGPGDPLNLPGYPFSFFVYKQIAADNAALMTEAFLQNWDDA